MAYSWTDALYAKLSERYGEKKGSLLAKKYSDAFSNSYKEDFDVSRALVDIGHLEKLNLENPLEVALYKQKKVDDKNKIYLKLFQYENPIALSDVLPILENMDLRTFSQRPYKMKFAEKPL